MCWLRCQRRFSPHSFRHTFGVACARAGLSLVEIRDYLGHSTTAMTVRYARHMPRDERRRDQITRSSAAYVQQMPVVEVVSSPSPQISHPTKPSKARNDKGTARVRMMKQ